MGSVDYLAQTSTEWAAYTFWPELVHGERSVSQPSSADCKAALVTYVQVVKVHNSGLVHAWVGQFLRSDHVFSIFLHCSSGGECALKKIV